MRDLREIEGKGERSLHNTLQLPVLRLLCIVSSTKVRWSMDGRRRLAAWFAEEFWNKSKR